MNYSEIEHYGNRIDDDALIEAAARLVPPLGPALFGAITHLAQAHRLTPAQVKVILQVGTHGQMAIGEIASSLTVSMPAVSELVDRLVDTGHLTRASDPADRRRVLVVATPRSLHILEELHALRRAQVRHALGQLSPEERPVFVRALQAFLDGLTSVQAIEAGTCAGPDAPGSGGPPDKRDPMIAQPAAAPGIGPGQ